MIEQIDKLPFQKCELDVSNKDNFVVKVELGRNPWENIDVEYRDDKKNINARGKEAFNLLYSKLKKLTIDQTKSQEEAISQVLQTFELKDWILRSYTMMVREKQYIRNNKKCFIMRKM